jgi:ribosomal-protein-alanine N-acetyltransferase
LEKVITSSIISEVESREILLEVQKLDQGFFSKPWSDDHWKEAFNNPKLSLHCIFSGKEDESLLLGFCLFNISGLESLAHLYKILIRPENRNSANASSLFAESLKCLAKQGIGRVYLEVSTQNIAAIRFYEKFGFESLNRIKKFYSNGDDAFAMQKII